ncbi:MAG: geranylgeranyl reductase family protein [Clostridia bacterium]|nr:geranylgeranyl reductase family protein [Clostridia bacterium]
MNYDVEVAVIGAGPAGSACGITLQKAGITNILIDKSRFPRNKTCGGLLTEKTYRVLTKTLLTDPVDGSDLGGVFRDVSERLDLYYGGERLSGSKVEKKLRSVRRVTFDDYLVKKYLSVGGTLLEETAVETFDTEKRTLALPSGGTVKYRRLVVADGALSPTRRTLGFETPELAFCTETYVPKADLDIEERVVIDFGFVKNGYVWVFPSGDDYCIGLGGKSKKDRRYDDLLKEYLASLGADPDKYKMRGAFLPFGKPVDQRKGPDFAVLAGDAAGFVDQVTGEGIYFALSSGIAAGLSAAEADFKKAYLEKVGPIAKAVKETDRFREKYLKNAPAALFRRVIGGRDAFTGFFCDNMISEMNYSYSKALEIYRGYKEGGK